MRAWRLLLLGVRNSGAAFIKWGQWSATREDLFPQVSAHLAQLCCLHQPRSTPLHELTSPSSIPDILQHGAPSGQAVGHILCIR